VSIQTRGIEVQYPAMRKLVVEEGRPIEPAEFAARKPVAILGHGAAKRLFQGAPAAGQIVLVQGRSVEIVGVMGTKIQDAMYEGPDDEQAFIPYEFFNELKEGFHLYQSVERSADNTHTSTWSQPDIDNDQPTFKRDPLMEQS